MTWTCTKCKNVNPTSECKCLRDGCDGTPWKEVGLSEEERVALDLLNKVTEEAGLFSKYTDDDWREDVAKVRTLSLSFYRAARAPLEAEVTKLMAAIKDLECQRDNATQATAASAERAERLREAYAREQQGMIDRGKQIAARDTRIHELKVIVAGLEAQLAQAQKPAAPAGLPEVGSTIRRTSFQPKLMKVSEHMADDHCRHKFRTEGGAEFWMEDEGKNWERIAPAQTSRGPDGDVIVAEGTYATHRIEREPSASPPGEAPVVTTANFTRFADAFYDAVQNNREYTLDEDPTYNSYNFHRVVKADIRANMERETTELRHDLDYHMHMAKQDKARIAELEREVSEWRRADLVHMQERDAALAEVERLRGELEKAKEAKQCPADGMSDMDIGRELWSVFLDGICDPENIRVRIGTGDAIGAKARELFTPGEK